MDNITKYKKDGLTWYKSVMYSYEYPKPVCDYCKQSMDGADKIFSLGFKVWHWQCHLIFFKERFQKEFEYMREQSKGSGE